jgi:hypothetical protein
MIENPVRASHAAKAIGTSAPLIGHWIRKGWISCERAPGATFIDVEELRSFLLAMKEIADFKEDLKRRGLRICRKCEEVKPKAEFWKKNIWCSACARVYAREYHLLSKYGMTPDEYKVMYRRQRGKCALCGCKGSELGNGNVKKLLAVDHCHKRGKIRSLLCHPCNRKLGVVENDAWMKKARAYLKSHR